jgi:RNA polymerase sigma-70 factor (ECF subfamily)
MASIDHASNTDELRADPAAVETSQPAAAAPDGHKFAEQLAAARVGSEQAIADLVEQCRQYLWLVASREIEPGLQPKVAASDLVQETYAEAAQKFQQFRGTTQAEWIAWLMRILESKLRRARRHYHTAQKRNVRREIAVDSKGIDLLPALGILSARTPGSEVAAREMVAGLHEALAGLPEEYRRVIELRNWQRKSFAEIGEELGRSADAARKLWCRAIERLGKDLERFGDG